MTKKIIVNVHTVDDYINEDIEFTPEEINGCIDVRANIENAVDNWMSKNWSKHSCIVVGNIRFEGFKPEECQCGECNEPEVA